MATDMTPRSPETMAEEIFEKYRKWEFLPTLAKHEMISAFADALRTYGAEMRRQALEEAEDICNKVCVETTPGRNESWNNEMFVVGFDEGSYECERRIRELLAKEKT